MIKQSTKLNLWPNRGRNRGLAGKILVPVILIFSLLMGIFFLYSFLTNRADNRAHEIQNSQQAETVFTSEIERLGDFALGLAIDAAANPEIQAAFAARDRARLQELTLNSYLALDEQFSIPQYQYHLPPARSFLRLHSLEKYGDDLSSFRFTVLQVNATKQPVVGLEVGRGGLGLRGIEPVFYEGRHIGSVEFGLNIGKELAEHLKQEYGNDWRIILTRESLSLATLEDIAALQEGPTPDLLIVASTIQGAYPDTGTYRDVLNGEKLVNQVTGPDNRTYSVTTMPLVDYSGKVIGAVEAVYDETSAIQAQTRRIFYVFLSGLLALATGSFILVTVTNRSLLPLESLTEAAEAIRQGNLDQHVLVTSQDEIGTLANTFNSMTGQLRDLVNSLEQRVADRTKDLATVARISTTTASIRDPFEMLATMVHLTQRGFDLYHAHVFIHNKDTQELRIVACGYKEGDEHEGTHGTSVIPIAQEQSLVARAARTRQPVIVNDVHGDPGWLPNPLLPDTRAEVAVPLLVGNEILGVLDVQSDHVDAFTEEDASILMTLASQVAISLQNARTFEESRAKAELESYVNAIGQKIQRTTSIEDTLQIAVREIGLALGAARVSARIAGWQSGDDSASHN